MATKKQSKKAATVAKKKTEMIAYDDTCKTPKCLSPKNIKKLIDIVHNSQCPLPVLDNVLMRKDHFICSDLETSIFIPFKSDIEALIPVRQMKTILDEYDDGFWSKTSNRDVTFRHGRDVIKMSTGDTDEYPKCEERDNDNYKVEHVGVITTEMISQMGDALKFVGHDELRPIMTCVYVFDQIVSTDAHKMFFENVKGNPFKEVSLFTRTAIKVIQLVGGQWNVAKEMSYFKDADGNKKRGTNKIICTSAEGIKIIFREFDGNYPQYKKVFPKKKELVNSFTIESSELLPILKRAAKFYNQTTKQVRFTVGNDEIKFHAVDNDFLTEYNTTVKVKTKGQIEIGFNASFIEDFCKQVEGKMTFKMTHMPNRAAIINDKYLVMPVMLNN